MATTTEVCSQCMGENELKPVLKLQTCSHCGAPIIPCSLCHDEGNSCDFHYTNKERTEGKCTFSDAGMRRQMQEPVKLENAKTLDLIKELENRAGVKKISVGQFQPHELKRRYDNTRDQYEPEIVLVVDKLDQLEAL